MVKRMLRDLTNLNSSSNQLKRLKLSAKVAPKKNAKHDTKSKRAKKRFGLFLKKVCKTVESEKLLKKFDINDDVKLFIQYIDKSITKLGLSPSTYFIAVEIYVTHLSVINKNGGREDSSLFHFKLIIAAITVASKFNEIHVPSIRSIRSSVSKSLKKRITRNELIFSEGDTLETLKFRIPSMTIYSTALSLLEALQRSASSEPLATKHIVGSLTKALVNKYPEVLHQYNILEISLSIILCRHDAFVINQNLNSIKNMLRMMNINHERVLGEGNLENLTKKIFKIFNETKIEYLFSN